MQLGSILFRIPDRKHLLSNRIKPCATRICRICRIRIWRSKIVDIINGQKGATILIFNEEAEKQMGLELTTLGVLVWHCSLVECISPLTPLTGYIQSCVHSYCFIMAFYMKSFHLHSSTSSLLRSVVLPWLAPSACFQDTLIIVIHPSKN